MQARQRGYAIDLDESFEGATCVAAPLRIGDSLVGAIGLSGPSARLGVDRVAEIGARLIEVSRRLATGP
jgi:DNA-binding IclR family transcriptional regulator